MTGLGERPPTRWVGYVLPLLAGIAVVAGLLYLLDLAWRSEQPVEALTPGSIRYRRCRRAEKKRLDEACRQYGWEANNRRGVQGSPARRLERAYCAAASRYRAVE